MPTTTRSTLDREFGQIQDNILRMGSLVDTAIHSSIRCLKNQDAELAKQIIGDDQAINDLRFAIEEECLTLIATQQPMASDLRAVIAAMNIVNDMERMGDHATGIAKTVLRMGDEPLPKSLVDFPRMADLARAMLKQSLDAYLARDADLARKVAERDDEIDHLYNQIFRELLSFMVEDPKTTAYGTYLLWVAHNLERIGDRVTNIAERVIYMTTGMMKELNVKGTPGKLDS
ncbi:MAG TPA: phosphate signaling complex protein PhoU [Anaerolineales bacterium]|nr:phosphate signaling complex protein PhoU [Anaerolineales bacterium]